MEQGDFSLSDREFSRIQNRIYQVAGISLSDAKRTLVISRLSKIVRSLGLPSFDAYLDHLERAGFSRRQDFVNALTTNLTRFYREDHHFDHLRSYVDALVAQKPRGTRLRIWSAGCSHRGRKPIPLLQTCWGPFPNCVAGISRSWAQISIRRFSKRPRAGSIRTMSCRGFPRSGPGGLLASAMEQLPCLRMCAPSVRSSPST